jgi:hypothetical protein
MRKGIGYSASEWMMPDALLFPRGSMGLAAANQRDETAN